MGGNSTSKLPVRVASLSMIPSPKSQRSPSPRSPKPPKLPYLELEQPASEDIELALNSTYDLKENLPDDLKQYTNSIEMTYQFWCNEIEGLSQDEYKEAAVLLYVNVLKAIPSTRQLFPKTIETQSKQFFSMLRWAIINLRRPERDRLIDRIKMLGAMHQERNVKPEWYALFLEAFHQTMHETFKDKYTARMRFCFEQLYTLVSNIMMGRDFHSLSSAKISRLLKALRSLEHCLADQEACSYLQLYLESQFCTELILFYKEVRRFKRCQAQVVRQKIGKSILSKFIDRGSQCEINISSAAKMCIYHRLKVNNNDFDTDIWDEACDEVITLMRRNTWHMFRESIMKMAVEEDMRYDEMRPAKSFLTLQRAASAPRSSMAVLSLHRKSSF